MKDSSGSRGCVAVLSAYGYQIGRRWRPGFVERKDTASGFYEAVNPLLDSHADITMQRALLKPIAADELRKLEEVCGIRRVGEAANDAAAVESVGGAS